METRPPRFYLKKYTIIGFTIAHAIRMFFVAVFVCILIEKHSAESDFSVSI